MNFIADSPEDVNGWVEGMELHVLRFSKTCSVAPVLLLVKFASSSSPPTFWARSAYRQSPKFVPSEGKLKGEKIDLIFFFPVAIRDLFSMVYRK